MCKGKVIKLLSAAFLTAVLLMTTISAMAEENDNHSGNRFYLGESVKTGWDNGYKGEEKITEGDVHFNWKIGEFYVDGFTSTVKGEDNTPIFLKNVGDNVEVNETIADLYVNNLDINLTKEDLNIYKIS